MRFLKNNSESKNFLLRTALIVACVVLIVAAVLLIYFQTARQPETAVHPQDQHQWKPVKDQQGEILYWTCTMHPSVKSKDPGKCPICSMDLVPVRKQPAEAASSQTAPVPTEAQSAFTVSPERQQLLGVHFTEVAYRKQDKTIRTVGRIELDERRIAYVNTKVSGWVERVYADFTYEHVRKGQPLFAIYSPDLVATQEEYLLALRARESLKDNPFQKAAEGSASLLEASRRRLLLWDVTEKQIAELERTGKVQRTLTVYAPISGHIIVKNVFAGMRVDPNMQVYTIADHSHVWVHADIYENELAFVQPGLDAQMTVNAYPGEIFRGKVTYLWPHLQGETRTAKVRLEFPNPHLKLKPEMYANVEIGIPLGEHLAVPESAILRTGKRNLVFVDRGQGRMEVRDVDLGPKAGNYYAIRSGLQPGERVVTAANFLIDAESKVQGAVAAWQGTEDDDDQ